MALVYDYLFEYVHLSDLQQAQLEAGALQGFGGIVIGASYSPAGISSLVVNRQLTTGEFNRLLTYMKTKAGGAVFLRMDVLEDG